MAQDNLFVNCEDTIIASNTLLGCTEKLRNGHEMWRKEQKKYLVVHHNSKDLFFWQL